MNSLIFLYISTSSQNIRIDMKFIDNSSGIYKH